MGDDMMKPCKCPLQCAPARRLFRNVNHLVMAYLNVRAVDLFLKPAWLCDHISTDITQMMEFLRILKEYALISRDLSVVAFGVDVLVMDVDMFLSQVEQVAYALDSKTPMDNLKFVTLTHGGESTMSISEKVASKLSHNMGIIRSQLSQLTSPICSTVELDDEWLTPTVFGIALGYPVVYILESDSCAVRPMDLAVRKLTIDLQMNCFENRHQVIVPPMIYAFSIPLEHVKAADECVCLWRTKICNLCDSLGISCVDSTVIRYNSHVTL